MTATAITLPPRRILIAASIGAILLFGLWGSTLGRPRINLSAKAGYEEGQWGYDALVENRDLVRDGLLAKAGKGAGKLVKVESLTKHGKLVAYEAQVVTDGKRSEVQVGPDGKSLDHEE